MRLFLFILFILPESVFGFSISATRGSWGLQARGDFGFLIAHRPALEPLQDGHVKGFEISAFKISNGSHWQSIFLNPDCGITFAMFDLGSPDNLGKGYALYPYVDFPMGRGGFNALHFRYGMGLGYVEKTFDAADNIKNAGIGSHLNAVIHFDLHYEANLSERSSLEFGTGITHYSNGSVSLPNLGINIATVNLSYSRVFGKSKSFMLPGNPVLDKQTQIHVNAGGFPKSVYPPNGKKYVGMALTVLRFKPINFKSAWGVGADIFYDNSITARIEYSGEDTAKSFDNFRPGIYGAYHLSLNKLGIMFNMGFYLYNAWPDDGNVYQRICLRYYFRKIFLCMNLKSHYARADFVEAGIGYRFLKNNK